MATATTSKSDSTVKDASNGIQGVIKNLQENEKSALDAVKRFVDTVNDAFPDLNDDGPRRKIIDAAFGMTQQVVDASNKLAINLVDVTENALENMSE